MYSDGAGLKALTVETSALSTRAAAVADSEWHRKREQTNLSNIAIGPPAPSSRDCNHQLLLGVKPDVLSHGFASHIAEGREWWW
jgi:hypothetical protein